MRRIPLLLLTVAAIVGLAGCTASNPTPSASAHTVAVKAIPVPDGTVGTGTLTSWNGKTTGQLRVVAKSGNFTLMFSSFSTDYPGQLTFGLADTAVRMTQCGENNLWQIGLTPPDNIVKPSMSLGLPNVADGYTDPSFFQTFLLLQYPDGTTTRGCQQPIIALAKIAWTMKPIYPGLTVHDSGKAASAEGVVKLINEKPFSYVTAVRDTWSSIAARFGLTPAELLYLNPIRHPEAVPAIAYEGQILNLDPANRGNSESRRPGAQ